MRPIASDTSVLLPALLSPGGQRRKLLVLLAFGGLNYYARVGLDELELLEEQAARFGGERGGRAIEELVERASDRKAALAEHLPALAPDDVMLVGSPALFDEFEAKVEAVGPRLLKDRYDPEAPAKYRRQLEVICGLVTPPFALDDTPEHTQGRDRTDDFVIETAFQGGALAIVSDDKKHIALDEDGTVYRDPRTASEVSVTGRAPSSTGSSTPPASTSTTSTARCLSLLSATRRLRRRNPLKARGGRRLRWRVERSLGLTGMSFPDWATFASCRYPA